MKNNIQKTLMILSLVMEIVCFLFFLYATYKFNLMGTNDSICIITMVVFFVAICITGFTILKEFRREKDKNQ